MGEERQADISLELHITPSVVRAYAEVAGDFNPIHFDDAAARAVGLPRRSAHGMISGALLSRLLTRVHGDAWLRSGVLSIKFVRPVLVGERVVARAMPAEPESATLVVRVDNEEGLPVIVGHARLAQPIEDRTASM
ncbi:MAG: 3-hydroxybutyryl-CoA dehydratase [Nocardioidaceae bacterium]|jgi:acyl dehydratase|nr:3-hydroxybutyryl-CoA dehydratase [Nocardioidaceae bacterium]